MIDLANLIPVPVTHNDLGELLPYWARRFPRSEAYEAAARPLLPPGWELYSVLDGDHSPAMASRDFGATRLDSRACVFGVRELGGQPLNLRASIPGNDERTAVVKVFPAGDLAEACRWCEQQIGARS